ncbi:hypothetical protein C8R43DRAFT_1130441 [Mycena crocata]|nr:hypothetical protein C8R43DRAFT_1130441 [Mycena crocata]
MLPLSLPRRPSSPPSLLPRHSLSLWNPAPSLPPSVSVPILITLDSDSDSRHIVHINQTHARLLDGSRRAPFNGMEGNGGIANDWGCYRYRYRYREYDYGTSIDPSLLPFDRTPRHPFASDTSFRHSYRHPCGVLPVHPDACSHAAPLLPTAFRPSSLSLLTCSPYLPSVTSSLPPPSVPMLSALPFPSPSLCVDLRATTGYAPPPPPANTRPTPALSMQAAAAVLAGRSSLPSLHVPLLRNPISFRSFRSRRWCFRRPSFRALDLPDCVFLLLHFPLAAAMLRSPPLLCSTSFLHSLSPPVKSRSLHLLPPSSSLLSAPPFLLLRFRHSRYPPPPPSVLMLTPPFLLQTTTTTPTGPRLRLSPRLTPPHSMRPGNKHGRRVRMERLRMTEEEPASASAAGGTTPVRDDPHPPSTLILTYTDAARAKAAAETRARPLDGGCRRRHEDGMEGMEGLMVAEADAAGGGGSTTARRDCTPSLFLQYRFPLRLWFCPLCRSVGVRGRWAVSAGYLRTRDIRTRMCDGREFCPLAFARGRRRKRTMHDSPRVPVRIDAPYPISRIPYPSILRCPPPFFPFPLRCSNPFSSPEGRVVRHSISELWALDSAL